MFKCLGVAYLAFLNIAVVLQMCSYVANMFQFQFSGNLLLFFCIIKVTKLHIEITKDTYMFTFFAD